MGGRAVTDLCREHVMSGATCVKRMAERGGMDASDIRRLRELEAECARLKQMIAGLGLGNTVLKGVIGNSSEAGSTVGARAARNQRARHEPPQGLRGVWREREPLRLQPVPERRQEVLARPLAPDPCWPIEFMRDTLYSGRAFMTFNAADCCDREALAVEVDASLP